ncbi:hypothetical protein Apmu_0133_05 [Acidiphilium multivorum AIU301]|nr:hypothetical protein Apmu_0133_05 [Acidiphilium multivorum AIU301]
MVASFRLLTLGRFKIVSFGGYEALGFATKILTPRTEATLPPAQRAAAAEIRARKAALICPRAASA